VREREPFLGTSLRFRRQDQQAKNRRRIIQKIYESHGD